MRDLAARPLICGGCKSLSVSPETRACTAQLTDIGTVGKSLLNEPRLLYASRKVVPHSYTSACHYPSCVHYAKRPYQEAHGDTMRLINDQPSQLPIPIRHADDGHPLGVRSRERLRRDVHDALAWMAHVELLADLHCLSSCPQ